MVTEKYLDACADEGSGLRDVMGTAELPELFGAAWRDHLLPRPLFVEERLIRGAAADAAALLELLASLPDRLFGGDIRAFSAAIGADERRAALMTRLGGTPAMYGRADLYHDGSGLRLLELNAGSELGGTNLSEVGRALLGTEAFGAFAKEYGLSCVDTVEAMAGLFREATGNPAPVVASLEAIGGIAPYLPLQTAFQESMRRLGIEVLLGEVDQVEVRDGRLFLHGRPIDLVLRYFSINQLAKDPRNDEYVEKIMRAHEDCSVVVWTTMKSLVFTYKSCLPLVTSPEPRLVLSAEETALVDRILPWTRTLTADLADRVRAERENVILKPFAGLSGHGIQAGWEQSDGEWARTVAECTGQGYIAQRRVVSRLEPVMDPRSGAVEDWLAVWGAFFFPSGYSGTFCRAVPAGTASVVTLGTKGAKATTALHY